MAGSDALAACGGTEAPSVGTAAESPAAPSRSPVAPEPGDHELALAWEGRQRTYHVHAPPTYRPAEALPLVVVLPYRGATTDAMRRMTGFDAKAHKEGFLVAYPETVAGAMNVLICCGNNDDVGFIRAMVDELRTTWGADPDRIYATGMSNGGDMSFRLAVEMPGVFAAIAPISGGFIGNKARDDISFKPSRPVSVVSFLGTADGWYAGTLAGIRSWRAKVGCEDGPAEWADRHHTVARTTSTCTDGSDLVSYTIKGMGHSWSGGEFADGYGDPTTKINAVDVMWAFFAAHPREGSA